MSTKTKKIMSDLLAAVIPLLILMDELIDGTLEDGSKGQARKSRKRDKRA